MSKEKYAEETEYIAQFHGSSFLVANVTRKSLTGYDEIGRVGRIRADVMRMLRGNCSRGI